MNVREETKKFHDDLESLPFNVRMFKGEQTEEERRAYLTSNQYIFTVLDQFVPKDFGRLSAIKKDLKKLGGKTDEVLTTSIDYAYYLEYHCRNIESHIYLNYMGFMYGGQIMKKKYPNSATTYEFTDIENKRLYIRENVCQDTQDFIDEVNEGYKWHIKISEELEKIFNGNVG